MPALVSQGRFALLDWRVGVNAAFPSSCSFPGSAPIGDQATAWRREVAVSTLRKYNCARPAQRSTQSDDMPPIVWFGLGLLALPFCLWLARRLLLAAIASRCPQCGSKFYATPVCGDR